MESTAAKSESTLTALEAPSKAPLSVKLALMLSRHTLAGRGNGRRLLGQYVKGRIGPRVAEKIWGAEVCLYPHSNQCDYKLLMKPSHYSRKEFLFLNEQLSKEGAVFFDIGANSGFFSLYAAAKATSKRKIFSFEPNPEMIRRLREKFDAPENSECLKYAEWHLCPFALGDADGTARLTIPEGNYGEAHLSEGESGIEVKVRTLMSVIESHRLKGIDLLKIDVEGFEDKIMRLFFETTDERLWPKAIIIEHVSRGDWQWDPIKFALENGYKEEFKTRNNMALVYQA